MKSDIKLRAAEPVLAEGLVFARYMNQASDDFFKFLLGNRSEEIIAQAYLSPNHSLSYENVTFAKKDGVVIGMICAFTSARHQNFSEETLKIAAGGVSLRLRVIQFLFKPLFNVLSTVGENDYYLLGIAVEPDCRGQGVGSILMNEVEQRARNSGSSRISLDVAANNSGARKMYERLGMVEVSRWPGKFIPPLFIRMAVEL